MNKMVYNEDFGGEHDEHIAHPDISADAAILAVLGSMMEKDIIGSVAVLLRVLKGHTYQDIGSHFRRRVCQNCDRPVKGITRQAVEQRVEVLARIYPGLAGAMLDTCARERITEDDGRKRKNRRK